MSTRVALVGHVDHGKSTLIGRLLSDTNQTRRERVERVESYCQSKGQKFEYAFLLDALEEEQAQGITIDTTEVHWNHQGREYTFVDTPGHREFLKKMVGGASSVDGAILIVDALEGPTESFQRQLMILDLLGIKQLIVVVNKMDLAGWKESTWKKRKSEILDRWAAVSSLSSKESVILPLSAWQGVNLIERSSQMEWYKGPSLAEALLQISRPRSSQDSLTRFYIQDVYRQKDKRIYVGRLESGSLRVGDELFFLPGFSRSRVRSIEVYEEDRIEARCGDAVGICLEDPVYLDRGFLAYSGNVSPRTSLSLAADIFWLDKSPLKLGDRLKVKSGTQSAWAIVEKISSDIDGDTFAEKRNADSLQLFGRVQFQFEKAWNFDYFLDCPATGRFVVAKSNLIAGGGRWVRDESLEILGVSSRTKEGPRNDLALQIPSESRRGRVLWLTGYSGAGKSTIARFVENHLNNLGVKTIVLDGDQLRQGLSRDLGFSMEDRNENIRRTAEVAKLMADIGLVVITALISPLREQRELARKIIGPHRFSEIYVDCPIEICAQRDPKGLYEKASEGIISNFTGVSSVYEAPRQPNLHLLSSKFSLELLVDQLVKHALGEVGIDPIRNSAEL